MQGCTFIDGESVAPADAKVSILDRLDGVPAGDRAAGVPGPVTPGLRRDDRAQHDDPRRGEPLC